MIVIVGLCVCVCVCVCARVMTKYRMKLYYIMFNL